MYQWCLSLSCYTHKMERIKLFLSRFILWILIDVHQCEQKVHFQCWRANGIDAVKKKIDCYLVVSLVLLCHCFQEKENWEIFILKQNETNRVRIAYKIASNEREKQRRRWKKSDQIPDTYTHLFHGPKPLSVSRIMKNSFNFLIKQSWTIKIESHNFHPIFMVDSIDASSSFCERRKSTRDEEEEKKLKNKIQWNMYKQFCHRNI